MRYFGLAIAMTVSLLSGPVFSGEADSESNLLFEGVNAFFALANEEIVLDLNDQVSDGCMAQPNSVLAAWEVELRRLGFSVLEEDEAPFARKLTISAVGYATQGGVCVVYVESIYGFIVGAKLPYQESDVTLLENTVRLGAQIMSGPKSDMNDRIADLSRDHVNALYLSISRAKERFEKEYPIFMEAQNNK